MITLLIDDWCMAAATSTAELACDRDNGVTCNGQLAILVLVLPYLILTALPNIIMSATYDLWCIVEGDNAVFSVSAESTESIGVLQTLIKKKKFNLLKGVDASSLILSKVRYSDYCG